MKIQILSDLHYEFFPSKEEIFAHNYFNNDSDMIFLAGDICVFHQKEYWNYIFDMIYNYNKPVYYVCGNHEYYQSDINKGFPFQTVPSNFHHLNNSLVNIGNDYKLFGGTMWSDFNLYEKKESFKFGEPFNLKTFLRRIKYQISDFNVIHKDNKLFLPKDCRNNCLDFKKKLNNVLDEHENVIVLTHFCCHPNSIHMKYSGAEINPYFTTNCEKLIKHENLVGWIHGHTHSCFNYKIDEKFVICNPRGYYHKDYFENSQFESNYFLELNE